MADFPVVTPTNDLVLEPGQNLVVRDVNGRERLRLEAATGSFRIRGVDRGNVARLDASSANLLLGGSQGDGDLLLFPDGVPAQDTDASTIHLSAGLPRLRIGTDDRPGVMRVHGAGQVDSGERRRVIRAAGPGRRLARPNRPSVNGGNAPPAPRHTGCTRPPENRASSWIRRRRAGHRAATGVEYT